MCAQGQCSNFGRYYLAKKLYCTHCARLPPSDAVPILNHRAEELHQCLVSVKFKEQRLYAFDELATEEQIPYVLFDVILRPAAAKRALCASVVVFIISLIICAQPKVIAAFATTFGLSGVGSATLGAVLTLALGSVVIGVVLGAKWSAPGYIAKVSAFFEVQRPCRSVLKLIKVLALVVGVPAVIALTPLLVFGVVLLIIGCLGMVCALKCLKIRILRVLCALVLLVVIAPTLLVFNAVYKLFSTGAFGYMLRRCHRDSDPGPTRPNKPFRVFELIRMQSEKWEGQYLTIHIVGPIKVMILLVKDMICLGLVKFQLPQVVEGLLVTAVFAAVWAVYAPLVLPLWFITAPMFTAVGDGDLAAPSRVNRHVLTNAVLGERDDVFHGADGAAASAAVTEEQVALSVGAGGHDARLGNVDEKTKRMIMDVQNITNFYTDAVLRALLSCCAQSKSLLNDVPLVAAILTKMHDDRPAMPTFRPLSRLTSDNQPDVQEPFSLKSSTTTVDFLEQLVSAVEKGQKPHEQARVAPVRPPHLSHSGAGAGAGAGASSEAKSEPEESPTHSSSAVPSRTDTIEQKDFLGLVSARYINAICM